MLTLGDIWAFLCFLISFQLLNLDCVWLVWERREEIAKPSSTPSLFSGAVVFSRGGRGKRYSGTSEEEHLWNVKITGAFKVKNKGLQLKRGAPPQNRNSLPHFWHLLRGHTSVLWALTLFVRKQFSGTNKYICTMRDTGRDLSGQK